MHKVSVSIQGVITDSATIELGDSDAAQLFINLKRTIVGDDAPRKRGKRTASGAGDETVPATQVAGDSAQEP